ncbi:MAG: hypothetical protein ABJA10_00635 [Aestuariivirga sp.]
MLIKNVMLAGLLTLVAPVAAYANAADCGIANLNCGSEGTNLIGKSVTSYELATPNNASDSSVDYLTPPAGERNPAKIVKVYRTDPDILNVPKGMPQIGAPQG